MELNGMTETNHHPNGRTDTETIPAPDTVENDRRREAACLYHALNDHHHEKAGEIGAVFHALPDTDTYSPRMLVRQVDRVRHTLAEQNNDLSDEVRKFRDRIASDTGTVDYAEWEWGDPCPDCGATTFALKETKTVEVTPEQDGDLARHGTVYNVADRQLECAECWTVLPVHYLPE